MVWEEKVEGEKKGKVENENISSAPFLIFNLWVGHPSKKAKNRDRQTDTLMYQ